MLSALNEIANADENSLPSVSGGREFIMEKR
jgi:hypothetical protein